MELIIEIQIRGKNMAKRGLKLKVEGQRPNDLCRCHSGLKYKKCHGKGTKGTGIFPRESANRHNKPTHEQITESTRDILQFQMMRQMMRKRNPGIKI